MRKTITISLPEEMHADLLGRVDSKNYSTVSEYFRELIRLDRNPVREPEKETPPFEIMTANERLRRSMEAAGRDAEGYPIGL